MPEQRRKGEPLDDAFVPVHLNQEMMRLAVDVEKASDTFRRYALRYARAEEVYRHRKAVEYTRIVAEDKARPRKEQRTVAAITAEVDILCENERRTRSLNDALKEAAKERLRALQASLSAVQSVASSIRAEIQLAGTGPRQT